MNMVSMSTITSPICDDQLRCLPYVYKMDKCKLLCIWITNRVCLSQCKCHSANYCGVMSLATYKTWPLWKDGPSNNMATNGLPTSWPLWNLFILMIVMKYVYYVTWFMWQCVLITSSWWVPADWRPEALQWRHNGGNSVTTHSRDTGS